MRVNVNKSAYISCWLIIILFAIYLSSCSFPYFGKVIDSQTGEPVQGACIVRSWNKRYATPAGGVTYFLSLNDSLSEDNGRFYVNGIIHFPDIPIFTNTFETTLIFKPGYKSLLLKEKPFTVTLERIPTTQQARTDELKNVQDRPYFDENQRSNYFYSMMSTEKEFLDIMEEPSKPREFWFPFSEMTDLVKPDLFAFLAKKVETPQSREKKALEYIRILTDARYATPMRTEAIWYLSNTDDPRAFDLFVAAMKEKKLRNTAMGQLTRLNDPRAEDFFIAAMDDDDAAIRSSAVYGASKFHDEKAIKAFKKHISDTNEIVRFECRKLSGFYDTPEGQEEISNLINRLPDKSRRQDVTYKLKSIGRIGQPAVDKLIVLLKNKDVEIVEDATSILGTAKDSRAVTPLMENLSLGDRRAVAAAKALGNYKEDRVAKALVDALRHNKNWSDLIRGSLVKVGSPKTFEYLMDTLNDENVEVRRDAAQIISSFRDPRLIDRLSAALKDNDFWVRKYAAQSLVQIKDPRAVAPLFSSLHDRFSDVRSEVAQGLINPSSLSAKQGLYAFQHYSTFFYGDRDFFQAKIAGNRPFDEAAIKQLTSALRDTDPYIRWKSAWCLGERREESAVAPLVILLNDKESQVRWAAIDALEKIRHHDTADKLLALCHDSDVGIRDKAKHALSVLGNSSGCR